MAAGTRRVTLLHVQDLAHIEPHLSHGRDAFDAIDRARLAKLRVRLEAQGAAEVEAVLRAGSPLQEIVALASESGTHLVVLGSQDRGYLAEIFLGSVGHKVARHAATPVLLIPVAR